MTTTHGQDDAMSERIAQQPTDPTRPALERLQEIRLTRAERQAIRRVLQAAARHHEIQRPITRLTTDGRGLYTHEEFAQHLRAADALLNPRKRKEKP